MQSDILANLEERRPSKRPPCRWWSIVSGYGASKDVENSCFKSRVADGSSSGVKRGRPLCPCSWKRLALKWKKSSLKWLTRLGQEVCGLEKGIQSKKETWRTQIINVQMWRQVRGPARAVMCENRDLGIK